MNQKKPHGKAKEKRENCMGLFFFFPGEVMKNKINFQLYFNLPTYISNGEMQD